MARVLLAWELGGGFGHLAKLRLVARALRREGHECLFAVRLLENAAEFLEPELGPVLQAPVRVGPARNPVEVQLSYASLLHNIGFDDPAGLAGRISAWRALMRIWRVDRLLADHSPIALVAAQAEGIPAAAGGSGFMLPPLQQPFPSFQPWSRVEPAQLERNEALVLLELNRALERLRLPPYANLQQIFRGCTRLLLTYPELDHYEMARDEPYLGVPQFSDGAAPRWADGTAPKILAYLRPHPHIEPMLQALSASRARVLLRIAEIDAERLRAYQRPGFVICDQPVDLQLAAQECDAYINYSAYGNIVDMLLAGKPGVLWPDQLERALVGRRVEQLGAAVVAPPQGAFDAGAALERALTDPALRQAAAGFAARYGGLDRAALPELMAQRLLAATR